MKKGILGVAPFSDAKARRDAGEAIANILNNPEFKGPERKRLLWLVEGLRSFALEPGRRETLAAELNPILRKFPIYPQLDAGKNRPGEWKVVKHYSNLADYAQVLVSLLLYGARDNGINWLRQCKWCGKWFFASREKNVLCSEFCWDEMYHSRPGYAQQNAKYQKKWYDTHRNKTHRKRRKKGGK